MLYVLWQLLKRVNVENHIAADKFKYVFDCFLKCVLYYEFAVGHYLQ